MMRLIKKLIIQVESSDSKAGAFTAQKGIVLRNAVSWTENYDRIPKRICWKTKLRLLKETTSKPRAIRGK